MKASVGQINKISQWRRGETYAQNWTILFTDLILLNTTIPYFVMLYLGKQLKYGIQTQGKNVSTF